MIWFDADIAPPAPRNLIWLAAALLSLLVAALSLWPAPTGLHEPRAWVRDGDVCRYLPATESAEVTACQ